MGPFCKPRVFTRGYDFSEGHFDSLILANCQPDILPIPPIRENLGVLLRTCVRSSRLSLYARTQRLTENAPYKGLWLVVKTTTNQPHSVKCRKAALASIHPNSQNGNQGEMAVIRPSICLLPFWKQAKSVGQFGQLKKPDELRAGIRKSLPVSLPGAGVQRVQPFAPVI